VKTNYFSIKQRVWRFYMNESEQIKRTTLKSANSSRFVLMILFLLISLFFHASVLAASQSRPNLEIFSKEIIQNIKQTSEVAGAMEQSLKDVISRLEKQDGLYHAAHCDSDEQDIGCDQLRAQLGETYLEMLDSMEESLPEMEHSLATTHASLEKRIYKQMGKNLTAAGLQDLVKNAKTTEMSPSLGKRALSKRVSAYYNLVRNGSPGSLSVVAAELYVDSHEVVQLLGLIREEIGRSRLMVEIGQSWGIVSPEMQNTVQGVKSILFGQDVESGKQVEKLTASAADTIYRSPLELR